jgi:cyanophycinase-like exopeptidase
MSNSDRSPGTVTLMGSGEMTEAMGRVHRTVMSRINGPVRAVFMDTPAGFQLNADEIASRAVRYFRQYLDLSIDQVNYKAAVTATPSEVERALRQLRRANYIFAGPGSPSYTIRNWQRTAVFEAISRRLAEGQHIVFASAAAVTLGRYALPVYEVYKVGESPHWIEGLDLLRPYGYDLAIVPHWNNAEGGTHDTRFCWMGEPRFRFLEQRLPESTTVFGIDEYTACIIELSNGQCQVMGAGQVTIRRRDEETIHPAGTTFDLTPLRGTVSDTAHPVALAQGEDSYRELLANWYEPLEYDQGELAPVQPLVDLLVATRSHLRDAKQWELADSIRDELVELGFILEDGEEETTWRRIV